VQINLGLDAFLTALEQEAKAAVDTPLDPPLDPQVIQHLQTMGDLAAQLKAELTAITALDPTALDRLKQRKQSAAS
jgi:orotidine-5'-phosphate decarboxylase